ncbi:receptor-like protein 6 [Amaranthus tricolor]|uniref:receptor-like protein 6 n=1 Tax=Amaranthus tricolor TaxID=29722 RepID=UPI002584F218|nr:receptor-like protein 6 [Amaranthus tricolor]
MKIWLSACKLLLVLVSFSLLLSNSILLLANPSSSLHQPKILCNDQEKYALLHFKQSFSIDCGKSYPVVAYSKLQMWPELDHVGNENRVDCCWWDGVICNNETGHVIGLDLSSSCLYGNFPLNSTIFGLDHLVELNLADNNFTYSQIPSEIAFSGQIPAEMAKLSSLSYLDLSYNGDFLGAKDQYSLKLHDLIFEKLLANLTQITQLFLSRVDISSTVPLFVANRTSLQAISLHDCNLLGKIPPNLLKLPNLEEVELYSNLNLRGHLPDFHSNSPLRYLLLAQTSFSGKLPNSLGNLASLEILDLEMCYFKGNIPFSLGNLSKLTTLSLSHNHLRGDFPSTLVNLSRLTTLSLSDIKIIDPVILKSWLVKLNKLTQLELFRMNLNDEILPNLANLTSLTFLNLKDNQLTAPLSHWLVNLTQLKTLYLEGNQFQGTIPPWLHNFLNLESLGISFKGSRGRFDPFLKLPNLFSLYVSGLTLTFPSNISSNSSVSNFSHLGIESCYLTEFPEFLRYQKELQELSLSQNNIVGDIPHWFVNTTRESLIVLDLSDNLLTSFEQPQTILPWVDLEILNLDDNKFRGQVMIPPSSMQAYQVKNNRYSGVIPKEICQASSLVFLDFSNNSLRGHIPNCISHQLGDSLQVLNLQGNNFDGTIPQKFSKSCKLKMINLSQNQFKGDLPKSLINCRMLEVLDVGKNHINDTFPTWLGSLPRLAVLVLRYNRFHGKIATPKLYYGFPCLCILDTSYNFHTGDLPSTYFQSWSAMKVSSEEKSDSYMSSITIGLNYLGIFYPIDLPYDYVITISNKVVKSQKSSARL